jgi:low temperature requirement protein LtrA
MLIALGESVIAIGVGVGQDLDGGVTTGAVLGMVVVFALWWLYFDVAAIFARRHSASWEALTRHASDCMPTAISTCACSIWHASSRTSMSLT